MKRLNRFFLVFSLLLVLIIFLGPFWMDWVNYLYFKHQGHFLFAGIDSMLVWLLAPCEFYLISYYVKIKFKPRNATVILSFIFVSFYILFCLGPFLIIFQSLNINNKPDPKLVFPFNFWPFAIHSWSWGIGELWMSFISIYFAVRAFIKGFRWQKILAILAFILTIGVLYIMPGLSSWIMD